MSNSELVRWTSFPTIDNMQLMHSFEVNIRICQPKNSDVHWSEAEVNITFESLQKFDVNWKRMQQLFCYVTLSLFFLFYIVFTYL